MGVVRIDDKLQGKIQDWIKKNGNKYKHSSITSFINSAIYEKIVRENGKKEDNNGSK